MILTDNFYLASATVLYQATQFSQSDKAEIVDPGSSRSVFDPLESGGSESENVFNCRICPAMTKTKDRLASKCWSESRLVSIIALSILPLATNAIFNFRSPFL